MRTISKEKNAKLVIFLPEGKKKEIKIVAATMGMTMTGFIDTAVQFFLEKKGLIKSGRAQRDRNPL